MSAEIDMSNDRANIAFVGEVPWHGLGQELTEDASIETWKKEAGMDWKIEESPVLVGNTQVKFDGKKALYRGDTNTPLSIVSEKYQVVQPEQVIEFFRDLTEDLGMKLNTAGCLFGGKRFWALADTGLAAKILGNDEIKGKLLLTSSCDGMSATVAQFTSVRVVCNNTLTVALNEQNQNKARLLHSQVFSPESIKSKLGLMADSWDNFMSSITKLSEVEMNEKQAREFVTNLFLKDTMDELSTRSQNKVEDIIDLSYTGMGSNMTRGTLWGVLNGVTEYFDHHTYKKTSDAALWDSWYGWGSNIKNKAYQEALELI
jgi:phage/plasmid-like protein (TIGR03299 family)